MYIAENSNDALFLIFNFKWLHSLCARSVWVLNRKHFPCFHTVIETLTWKFGRIRICMETLRSGFVFPLQFLVLPNFHAECFYNCMETRTQMIFYFLNIQSLLKVYLNIYNLNQPTIRVTTYFQQILNTVYKMRLSHHYRHCCYAKKFCLYSQKQKKTLHIKTSSRHLTLATFLIMTASLSKGWK